MATVIGSGKIRVDSGDTLSGIAQQYLGSSGKWKELGGYSGDPRKMPAGTILTLPGGGGQSGSAQSGGDMNTLVDAMMGKGYNNRAEAEAVAKGDFDRYWKEYVGAGGNLESEAGSRMVEELSKQLIELEDKLSSITGVALTDEEMDAFLTKALEQVTPYYDTKRKEIEAGIKEGRIQDAEDLLFEIANVREETTALLKRYDIEKAETEEEFVDTLAEITAKKGEDIGFKREEWKQRIETGKETQVQEGVLTSGIGMKKIKDMVGRQFMEESAIERGAGVEEETAKREQKYDLERVTLARETAEKERVRRIGTTEEAAATEASAEGVLGGELGSRAEALRARSERNIPIYSPTAATDLEERRKQAVESRKQELQETELAARKQQETRERQKILTSMARTQRQMGLY